MDPRALGDWLSGEVSVLAHPSFWVLLFLIGVGIWRAMEWRYRGMIERLADERDSLTRKAASKAANELKTNAAAQPLPVEITAPPEPRVFVERGVTPTSLKMLYRKNTTVNADRAVAPFLQKWMKVSGEVHDVRVNADGSVFVNIDWEDPKDADRPFFERLTIVLLMFQRTEDRLELLQRGETISATGALVKVNSDSIILGWCALA